MTPQAARLATVPGARIVIRPDAAPGAEEVTVAKFSTGTSFEFTPRQMFPVVPG